MYSRQQDFVKGHSIFHSRIQLSVSIPELNLPYLENSKETNKNVKNICYHHCCIQNDSLVGSSLMLQLPMHG